MNKIEQIFHHCKYWEDIQNGMFRRNDRVGDDIILENCKKLLANEIDLYNAMTKVTKEWKYSTEVQLSNSNQNRKAWMGWAACCIKFSAPDIITRKSWFLITEEERTKANLIADKVISEWENCYLKEVKINA